MALKTGLNPNGNLVYNGEFSSLVENGQILVLDEPLMIYTQENIQNDCSLVLESTNNTNNQNFQPEIVFDGNYYQFENLQNGNIPDNYGMRENFQYINERQQVDDGLAVLEILCNNKTTLDQPEFIDINKLSDLSPLESTKTGDVLCLSDDDDVIFVREYKEGKKEDTKDEVKEVADRIKKDDVSPSKRDGRRRNPVRKARVNSKKLSKEHILEEDFALLDTSDEEKRDEDKENKMANKKPPPPNETLKQWPVNAHERPEYNTETKKIEAFDYTIREIQKKTPNKKPRLETVPVKRKSKKKYFTRKRKPRVVEAKKVPIRELKPLVNSTTEMLKNFFISCREARDIMQPEYVNTEKCNVENRLEVFRNQIILFSVVNEMDQDEVMKKLDEGFCLENETKD